MYFTRVLLTGITPISLPIVGALPSDVYILKSVEGLGPPEVDVSITKTLNAGGVYQGRQPQNREIVLMIGLNPNYKIGQTVSDLRESLYGFLTPGYLDHVVIEIVNGVTTIAKTIGYVKKIEINPFSKDPQVQVTLACLKPYFEAPTILYITPGGDRTYLAISNTGNAPTGFYAELTFSASVSSWSLLDGPITSDKKMVFNYNFLNNDVLSFDTRPGFRGIWLTRASVKTNIINSLSSDSIWFMLHGGSNQFDIAPINYSWGNIYYLPQYWGI